MVAREGLRLRPADPRDAAVAHVGRRHRRAREEQGGDGRAAVLVRRDGRHLGERAPEGVAGLEARLSRAEDREMKVGGGAIRDAGAAVAVVDRGEQAVRRRLDRPAVLHVVAAPDVGGDADPGRERSHGFGRRARGRRGVPAHSATSLLSSMIT